MIQSEPLTFWRKCTTCKKLIGFEQKYWVCSVSTCNRNRTGLVFCDLRCFDAHIPVLNHRDAGAFEKRSPTQSQAEELKVSLQSSVAGRSSIQNKAEIASDILVIVSKVKKYIKDQSGMNTSDAVMECLTEQVKVIANQGILNATKSGRKTVLERDFE